MLYKNTISYALNEVAITLCSLPELADFRIVGGTAAALQLGHRKSVDIDFFSNERPDRQVVLSALKRKFPATEFFVNEH